MADFIKASPPLWRQPFVQFFALGALLFAGDAIWQNQKAKTENRISVSAAQIEHMAGLWTKTRTRPPSDSELQGLVRDYIKEEIYAREARRLGLDINDTVIRRRLYQKMEFLATGMADIAAADEGVLRAFYAQNIEKYQRPATYDISHIYYKSEDKPRMAADLLRLNAGADRSGFGDVISLPKNLSAANEAQITRLFGSDFYAQMELRNNENWFGRVQSGFGFHLVKAKRITDAAPLAYERVEEKVQADWKAQAGVRARAAAYEALRSNYSIDIEMPTE